MAVHKRQLGDGLVQRLVRVHSIWRDLRSLMHVRRATSTAVLLGVVGLVVACSSGVEAPVEAATPRPASRSAIDNAMVDCLRDAGYNARLAEEEAGGVLWDHTEEQAASARLTYDRCTDELIAEGVLAPPEVLTDARLREKYVEQDAIRDCLQSEGYDLPPMPSLDTYVASQGEWAAYLYLPDVDRDEWRKLNEVCPQE